MSDSPLPTLLPQISAFDAIKHRDENGQEYWVARELMKLLGYGKWQNFERAIAVAMEVCSREGDDAVALNFTASSKVSRQGKNTYDDYHLTRHACYVVAESADGRKEEVAWAKIYFALTTERHELLAQSEEDRLRFEQRQRLLLHNAELAMQARIAGVITSQQFQAFFNAGYRGPYNGETAAQIRQRKGLRPGQDISDWMGSLESAANDMRAALALHHMRTRGVSTVLGANLTHNEAGKSVRRFLASEGVKPEELLTPTKSYQHLLREQMTRERLAAEDRAGLWTQLPPGVIVGSDEDEQE